MRITLLVASLLLSFALGWVGHVLYVQQNSPSVEERVDVLNEQVRKIAQLATAEQRQNVWLSHRDVYAFDLPGFRKSAMLNARSRITAGFDLEGVSVEVDEGARTVRILDWPPAQELSFEVDTRYFDIDQGLFNTFETRELNALDTRIRSELRDEIDYPALRDACYEQADDLLGVLRAQLELTGWRLEVDWPPTAGEIARG